MLRIVSALPMKGREKIRTAGCCVGGCRIGSRCWRRGARRRRRGWGQGDAVGALVVDAQAADQIGRAFDAGEAAEDRVLVLQIIAQGEDAAGVAAEIRADRRPLPEDLQRALVLHVEQATAIARADGDGGRAFLAGDVGGGSAVVAEQALDRRARGLGRDAEEVRHGRDKFFAGVGFRALAEGPIVGWPRGAGGDGGRGQGKAGSDQGSAVNHLFKVSWDAEGWRLNETCLRHRRLTPD